MNVTINFRTVCLDLRRVATLFKDDALASDYIIFGTLLLLQSRSENLGFQLKSCSTYGSDRRIPPLPINNIQDYCVIVLDSQSLLQAATLMNCGLDDQRSIEFG